MVSLELDRKQNGGIYFVYIGGYRIVNNEHLQHMEMVGKEEDKSERFSGLSSEAVPSRGVEKKITLTLQRYVIFFNG